MVDRDLSNSLGLNRLLMLGTPINGNMWARERYSTQGTTRGPISELSIDRNYNFGNNVRQILNAIDMAAKHHIKRVIMPTGSLVKPGDFMVEGELVSLRLKSASTPARRSLSGGFFYPQPLGLVWSAHRRAVILGQMNCDLPTTEREEVGLAIHLRSGDVFGPRPHKSYAPPPLRYFEEAISLSGCDTVDMVIQDNAHPYIARLKAFCRDAGVRVRVSEGGLRDDLAILAAARDVCLSQGTMGLAMAWLSKRVEQVYAYELEEANELLHLGRAVTMGFGGTHVADWTASQYQIEALMDVRRPIEWVHSRYGFIQVPDRMAGDPAADARGKSV